jgi:hypothetical protein
LTRNSDPFGTWAAALEDSATRRSPGTKLFITPPA